MECNKVGNLTIRLDSAEGPVIGTVKIQPTRSLENYRSFTAKVKNAYGVHDLYLCFDQCTKEVHLDWWSFK
ncbi:MAG: carbohydrate-binding protein [Bacteroidaceae bacterium]|nr:carbohydrate-binding protein [Bacteroidaceae bacterium]